MGACPAAARTLSVPGGSSSTSSNRAISCSIPASSARIAVAVSSPLPNRSAQDRVEEQHRRCAERPVRPARLEEVDGRWRSTRAAGSRGPSAPPTRRAGRRWAHRTCSRGASPSGSRDGPARCRAPDRHSRVHPGTRGRRPPPRIAKTTCCTVGLRCELVLDRRDRDRRRLLDREATDPGAECRKRDAGDLVLAGEAHRAPHGRLDGRGRSSACRGRARPHGSRSGRPACRPA